MGSFNISCFASRQTISEGEPCRVIAIRQAAGFNPVSLEFGGTSFQRYGVAASTCGPDGFWEPVSGFFKATYADYGRVIPELDGASRAKMAAFFEDLRNRAAEVLPGANPRHEPAFNLTDFMVKQAPCFLPTPGRPLVEDLPESEEMDERYLACWDYIWETAQTNRLFRVNHSGELRPVLFAAIHEEAYQALVDLASRATTYDGLSMEPSEYFKRLLTEAHEHAAVRLFPEIEGNPRMLAFHLSSCLRDGIKALTDISASRVVELHGFRRALLAHLENEISEEALIEVASKLMEPFYALSGMGRLNLKFSPVEYAGQDYRNELGKEYAEFIALTTRRVTRSGEAARYGKHNDYTFVCKNQATLDRILAEHRNWDMAIEVISASKTSVAKGAPFAGLLVQVSATAEEEDFRMFIDSVGDSRSKASLTLTKPENANV